MRIQFFNNKKKTGLTIDFGYNSPVFESMYWLTVTREYYDDDRFAVSYAKMIFFAFKDKKFK